MSETCRYPIIFFLNDQVWCSVCWIDFILKEYIYDQDFYCLKTGPGPGPGSGSGLSLGLNEQICPASDSVSTGCWSVLPAAV